MHLETAVGMWQLLFAGNRWPLVNEWCEFLQKHHNRAISKDTWTQVGMDDWCEFWQKRHNRAITKDTAFLEDNGGSAF